MRTLENGLVILVGVAVLSCFFFSIHRLGVNIPFSDDFEEILAPVYTFATSDDVSVKYNAVQSTVGYSKAVVVRLVALSSFYLLGTVDLKSLMFVGNLSLVGVLWVLYRAAGRPKLLYFLSVVFLLFQLQYWEAIYQTTLSLCVPMGLFSSLLALYCLQRRTWRAFSASMAFAAVAAFAFGNGLLVIPVAVLYLLFERRFREAAVALGLFGLCVLAFSVGYSLPSSHVSLGAIFSDPLRLADWGLTFMGSSIGYAHGNGYLPSLWPHLVSVVVGLVILAFYLYLAAIKYYARNPTLYAFFTWSMATVAMATRCRLFDECPSASRYQVQSILLVVLCLLILFDLLDEQRRRRVFPVVLLASMAFCVMSYHANYYGTAAPHKNRLIFSMLRWNATGKGLVFWGDPGRASTIMSNVATKGFYSIPRNEQLLDEVILVPNDSFSYFLHGTFCNSIRKHREALADLSRAISIDPSYEPAYEQRMRACYALGDYDRAWLDAKVLLKSGFGVEPAFLNSLKATSNRQQ